MYSGVNCNHGNISAVSLLDSDRNALRERNFTPVSCPMQPAWQQRRSRTTRKYSANCCPTWTLDGSCTLRVARKQMNAYTMYSRRYTPSCRGYKATTTNTPMDHQSKWPRLPTCKKKFNMRVSRIVPTSFPNFHSYMSMINFAVKLCKLGPIFQVHPTIN